jgi:general secretion pathway protein M
MIDRLGERERLFLAGGAFLLVVVLGGYGAYQAYSSTLVKLDRTIVTRTRQLTEVDRLRLEALQLRQQIQQAEAKLAQSANFSLASYLEGQAEQLAGRGSLSYARPQPSVNRGQFQEEILEIKLERLALEQVLRLLWTVETAPAPMQVREFNLRKRFDDPALLDLTMTIAATRRSG